jgi:hypothetical protein
MSEFLKVIIESARKTAEEILSTLESTLTETRTNESETETLEEAYGYLADYVWRLESDLDTLNEELEEARTALKLFLDGETRRVFDVSETRSKALDDYLIETYWEGDSESDNRLVVRLRKI